jgi:hypothetical protein
MTFRRSVDVLVGPPPGATPVLQQQQFAARLEQLRCLLQKLQQQQQPGTDTQELLVASARTASIHLQSSKDSS